MSLSRPMRYILRAALWLVIYVFLIGYLHPELILRDTIPAGGDTTSHYQAAVFLRDSVLNRGRIVEWQSGAYAGFPGFQLYFPLPFLVMVGLSLAMPMTVAFKLVTIAGVLTLPLAAAYFIKKIGFANPAPDLAAVFSLTFLFMEANSAWGGNIPSTLAGEFAYSIGLSLSLVYLGRFYALIDTGRGAVGNAVLLALVGFAHGYTLLFCVIGAAFFLMTGRNWLGRLEYILRVNILAFCLMGFWIVPLILFLPYSTPFNFVWTINGWATMLPPIVWPAMAASAAGMAHAFLRRGEPSESRRRFAFLFYIVVAATVFYLIAFKIGVVDVRFLPFGQVFLVLAGAGAAGRVIGRLEARELAALSLALAAAVWTAHFERSISSWTRWNYSGWEAKPLWPAYQKLVTHLEGGYGDGRIVYEHAARTNAVGTIRAFECLPLFAGRATLEGAYIQASPNAPYVFYIQSETSPDPSVPLSLYNYGRFDPERALRHLALFNVSQYITVTEKARRAIERSEGYRLEFEAPPFSVFRVENSGGEYAVQPRYRPVLRENGDPRREGFEWFRFSDGLVPVVFARDATEAERKLFGSVINPAGEPGALRNPPRVELPAAPKITATMGRDEITVEGAEPGKPLWIKVSYHPNWKVEGAAKVWRTAPAFMLVFPEQSRVRLHFGWGFPDYLGSGLTIIAFLVVGAGMVRKPQPGRLAFFGLIDPLARQVAPYKKIVAAVAGTVGGGLLLYLVAAVSYEDPTVYFNRGVSLFNAGRYEEAGEIFRQGLAKFPISREADQSLHHLALSRYNNGDWAEARETWLRLEREFPESRVLQQAYYHLGLTAKRLDRADEAGEWFSRAIDIDLGSPWADAAMKELFGKAPPNGDK